MHGGHTPKFTAFNLGTPDVFQQGKKEAEVPLTSDEIISHVSAMHNHEGECVRKNLRVRRMEGRLCDRRKRKTQGRVAASSLCSRAEREVQNAECLICRFRWGYTRQLSVSTECKVGAGLCDERKQLCCPWCGRQGVTAWTSRQVRLYCFNGQRWVAGAGDCTATSRIDNDQFQKNSGLENDTGNVENQVDQNTMDGVSCNGEIFLSGEADSEVDEREYMLSEEIQADTTYDSWTEKHWQDEFDRGLEQMAKDLLYPL
nr:hypothetical protein [Cressdnaviricota sp.]UOF79167.1 hypothetical protein [Cressdnaviricota sp.]UOF81671.1 hypothetical protein [Cressdnaviricota sp.]UOF82588.1 hypothetical protein [Cressdnaviricota sp.]UOF82850.1 hypothetical protein [Cressdnaviricota sp.]